MLSLLIIFSAFSLSAYNGINLLSFDASAESEGGFEYYIESDLAAITGISEELTGDIVIPDTLGGYPVGGLDEYAFANRKDITSVTFPDSVILIYRYAFQNCTSLERVVLGEGLLMISECAFESCTSLTSIHIPGNVYSVSDNTFKYCINLSEITVSPENENFFIDNGALCNDYSVICLPPKSGVKEFDVGNRYVYGYTFAYCEDLEYIYLGEEADLDNGYWVGTCPSLKACVVDEANSNWSSDENGALYDKDKTWLISYPPKTDAEDIILPDTVEGIHMLAFSGEYDSVLHISENFSDFFEEGKDILFKYSAFKGFEVSDYDGNFAVENGVLYTADKNTLLKYPISNGRSFFELPESTQEVSPNAFVSLDLSGNPIVDDESGFEAEDYGQLFLRPENLRVHVPCRMFWTYNEIEKNTLGFLGVKEVCFDIREENGDDVTEEDEKSYMNSLRSVLLFSLGYSYLDVPEESLEAILFEAVPCGEHNVAEPEEPDTPVTPDTPDEPQISYIEFETFPAKTGYVLGEAVNVDGTVLRVVYDNGDVEYVSEGYTYSPLKFEKVGMNYVTVYYQGFETGFEEYVELGPPRSITVNTANVKKEYTVGENFDEWGMRVTVNYADGSTETVYGGYEIHCDEFTQAGTYTVTVEYEGCQATFDVTVTQAKMLGAYVSSIPAKVKYTIGEELDTEGLTIDVMYSDYSMKTITDGFDVECDLSTAGTKYVQVTYTENGVTVTAEYEIEVKAPAVPIKVQVSDVSVMAGETVSVPVNISGNSGFMGFSFIFEYDETVLTPVSVTADDMLSAGSFMDSIGGTMPAGQLKVTYCGYENISADGTLFYVNFTASENISLNSTADISYIQKDSFDEDFEDVIFDCGSFEVSIEIPDDGKLRFYSESVTVNAGDELIVPVYVSNAEGQSSILLSLAYNDEIFTFKKISSDYDYEIIGNADGTVGIKFSNVSAIADEELLLNAVFDVAEYVEAKETVEISCSSAVESVCTNAKISVVNPCADDPAFIYTDKSVSVTDGFVDIPVYINNNHGIMGFGMNISYDSSVLEPVSVIRGGVISGGSFDNSIGRKQGTFKVMWSHSENVNGNGLLYTLRFRVIDGQKIKSVPVEIAYSQPDTFNEKWEDVALDMRIGKIITENSTPMAVMISKRTLKVDETAKLLVSCNFETTRKVWTSSNPDVATVDSYGNVTAVGEGECTIKVTCYGNGVQASAGTKIVVEKEISAESFKDYFRAKFDEFFRVKLYDILENIRGFIISLFRIAY